jgi:hypothetical protein
MSLLSNKYEINGGEMTFKSVSLDDEGLYQCVAENEFGSVSSSAVLTVEAGKHQTLLLNTAHSSRKMTVVTKYK